MRLANLSVATLWHRSYAFMTVAFVGLSLCAACSFGDETSGHKNSLRQQTGQEGSTVPRANPPYYPNTSGNIVPRRAILVVIRPELLRWSAGT